MAYLKYQSTLCIPSLDEMLWGGYSQKTKTRKGEIALISALCATQLKR